MNFVGKKLWSLIAILLSFLLLLSGCAKKEATKPFELAEKIKESAPFAELSPLSGDKLSSHFGFTDAHVRRYSVLISSSGESADTIAIFEILEQDTKPTVVTGISGYLTQMSSSFKNTIEAEYNKVSSRVLMELDDIIVLVICSDSQKVKDLLDQMGAKDLY